MNKKKLTELFVLFILVVFSLTVYLYNNIEQPKYVYSVRENIEDFNDGLAFELWCWREYANGIIDKEYIGYFTLQGVTNTELNRFNTSLCQKRV